MKEVSTLSQSIGFAIVCRAVVDTDDGGGGGVVDDTERAVNLDGSENAKKVTTIRRNFLIGWW